LVPVVVCCSINRATTGVSEATPGTQAADLPSLEEYGRT